MSVDHKQVPLGAEDDDVVCRGRHGEEEHFELKAHSQENSTCNEGQDTAVHRVLGEKKGIRPGSQPPQYQRVIKAGAIFKFDYYIDRKNTTLLNDIHSTTAVSRFCLSHLSTPAYCTSISTLLKHIKQEVLVLAVN